MSALSTWAEHDIVPVEDKDNVWWVPDDGFYLHRVHPISACEERGQCLIHSPSEHHMRAWRLHFRADRGIWERICPDHGIGHPDFDDLAWHISQGREYEGVHGCVLPSCCGYDVLIKGLPARLVGDGYALRSDGVFYTYWRPRGPKSGGGYHRVETPRRMALRRNDKGYVRVQFQDGGARVEEYLHRLMWETWRGPVPEGQQVRHLDGDNANNTMRNLLPGTQRDNEDDKSRHGKTPFGERHVNSRLTRDQVAAARSLYARGRSLTAVLESLSLEVSKATLHDAVSGRTWAHLESPAPVYRAGARGRRN